ncbi:ExbD/TolR family protein [Tritonibacter horizontis]|uniref:Biopolymer transport protein ExbD/TolR n=1 Tax=Tritonibacter horizontis TaxID=1768241 RepID=A0A132C020_9RHOB|nr:biopolymer transporter ExbD [Tritonibacter horizontis]KUP93929.1 biopolymer transport protein ExbD/TolR [Tritonibacter horizontis]
MRLTRPASATGLISLVPMIDVLLILLVFFMVTSTYLDLDMIAAKSPQQDDAAAADQSVSDASDAAQTGQTLMIRLGADGQLGLRGRPQTPEELRHALEAALAVDPLARVLILPSGAATTQALVTVLDIAAAANVQRLQVLRLEGRP